MSNIYHARLMFARPSIDGVDFALNGRVLHGKVGLEALPRLLELWPNLRGNVSYSVHGRRDGERLLLQLEMVGECHLQCQRCLGGMVYPVAWVQVLRLVPVEQIEMIDSNDELDCIEASYAMDLLAMVEDELLLGLPFAPRHPEGECAEQAIEFKRAVSPFAELANLDNKRQ